MPTDIPTGFGVSTVSTGFPDGDETDERRRVPTGSLDYEHMNSVPFGTRNDIDGEVDGDGEGGDRSDSGGDDDD